MTSNAFRSLAAAAAIAMMPGPLPAQAPDSPAGLSVDQVVDRVGQNEAALKAKMRELHPIIEVYIQGVVADPKLGAVPSGDAYFLGRFDWDDREGPKLRSLTAEKGAGNWLTRTFTAHYLPDGFAAMGAPDWFGLDKARYGFTFVRREFLAEARCLVFDVQPKNGIDGFIGRIWVEDRDFNIVRFNGINRDRSILTGVRKKIPFHVDSWRLNVAPRVWLPAYIYSEETADNDPQSIPRIKSQVRLWGYDPRRTSGTQEFTSIRIDEPTVRDDSERGQQLSPVQGQRLWEQQAEENIIDRLSRAGLLAPSNGVDKVLDTVVRNLEITNGITLEQEVRCRILLTSPLESFTVGHTIVLSRGLIDVLPDEASLAMLLSHELAHVVLGHQLIDTKFAFADRLMVPDSELLRIVRFQHDVVAEAAADQKSVELLQKSPYKDKLAGGGLFLRAVAANVKNLPNLIQAHLGEQLADGKQFQRLGQLMQQAPELDPERLDQVAALALGARIVVDPWSGSLDLLRTAAAPLSAREKVPLAIAPLVPYTRYVDAAVSELK